MQYEVRKCNVQYFEFVHSVGSAPPNQPTNQLPKPTTHQPTNLSQTTVTAQSFTALRLHTHITPLTLRLFVDSPLQRPPLRTETSTLLNQSFDLAPMHFENASNDGCTALNRSVQPTPLAATLTHSHSLTHSLTVTH